MLSDIKEILLLDKVSDLTLISLALIVVILMVLKNIRNLYLLSFLTLPGTFMHELMHFIVSLITLGNPVSFTIIPKKSANGLTLGSVNSTHVRWYNGLFIALAPLLLYPLAYYLVIHLDRIHFNTPLYAISIYFIANLIFAGTPSPTDWKLAFKKSWLLFVVIAMGVYIIKFKI